MVNKPNDACDRQPNNALIYYHLPKCAGTFMRAVLEKNFGDAYIPLIRTFQWASLSKELSRLQGRDICIAGHEALYSDSLLTHHSPHYFTILREPFSRFSSYVRYKTLLLGREVDVVETIEDQKNLYTRWLGENDLATALGRLDDFAFVGIQEQMTNCFAFLHHAYGVRNVPTDRLKSSQSVTVDVDAYKERFYAANKDDVALYEHAQELFARSMKGVPAEAAGEEESRSKTHVQMNAYNPGYKELAKLPGRKLLEMAKKGAVERRTFSKLVECLVADGRLEDAIALMPFFNELPQSHPAFPAILAKVSRKESALLLLDIAETYTGMNINLPHSRINQLRSAILLESLLTPALGYSSARKVAQRCANFCAGRVMGTRFASRYDRTIAAARRFYAGIYGLASSEGMLSKHSGQTLHIERYFPEADGKPAGA